MIERSRSIAGTEKKHITVFLSSSATRDNATQPCRRWIAKENRARREGCRLQNNFGNRTFGYVF